MKERKIVKINKEINFDLEKEDSILELLIYFSDEINSNKQTHLIYLILGYSLKFELEEFSKNKSSVNYAKCLKIIHEFHNLFYEKNQDFVFENYIFNEKTNKDKRISNLEKLFSNLEKIINIISNKIEIKPYKLSLDNDYINNLLKLLEEKSSSVNYKSSMHILLYKQGSSNLFDALYYYKIRAFYIYTYNKLITCFGHLLNDKKQKIEEFEMLNFNKPTNNFEIKTKTNYLRIFKENNAFDFFLKLKENLCINSRTNLADYSFVFRRLQKDDLIYNDINEKTFREFLFDEYEINLDKLKILEYCTTNNKESLYNLLKQ